MNRRHAISIAAYLLIVPASACIAYSTPRVATVEDGSGAWFGTAEGGIYFVRLELEPTSGGWMSTRFVDSAPRLYRVTKWSIAPSWYLSIEAEAVEGTDNPHLFIDGYCTSYASRLTITNRKGWSSDLIIYREDWFLDNAAQTKANIKH